MFRHIVIGSLLFNCCGSLQAVILNPSFESEHHALMPNGNPTSVHDTWGMPDDWSWRKSGNANGHGVHQQDLAGWSSNGNWSLYVFSSSAGIHSKGDYIEFYQNVDLTKVTELSVDIFLQGGNYTNSYLAIDSQKLWIEHQEGLFKDIKLDLSNFSGIHEIELGVEVFQPFGKTADGWTYFDNLVLIPEPTSICLLGLGMLNLIRRKR